MCARGGRHQYQSRLGLSREDRDSTNHGCSSEVWLTTRSMISFMSRSWSAATRRIELLEGAERRVDVLVERDVVPGVVLRRGVDGRQPDDVHAQTGQVVEATRDPREVPDAVTVAVGEAPGPDLVHDGGLPPQVVRVCHRGNGTGTRTAPTVRAGRFRRRAPYEDRCDHRARFARPEILARMIEAGLDVARLNFSHGTPEEHAETADRVRRAADRVGRQVAILQDLPGPKLRIGPLATASSSSSRASQ
jgi:hypothetical protein